jgi:hypothetical protein
MRVRQAWSYLFLPVLLHVSSAKFVNRTVDDTYGDGQTHTIQYEGVWHPVDCDVCASKPVPSQLWAQTVHHGDVSELESNPYFLELPKSLIPLTVQAWWNTCECEFDFQW